MGDELYLFYLDTQPVWRMIENWAVPLPTNWENFISMTENKEDLACFLGQELLAKDLGKVIIVSGHFADEETLKASDQLEAWCGL